MMTFKKGCAVAALALALPMAAISSGNAAPMAPASVLAAPVAAANNSNPLLTEVQWRRVGGWRGGYRGYGYRRGWGGAGVGVGLAAGALIGGAIAAGAANPTTAPALVTMDRATTVSRSSSLLRVMPAAAMLKLTACSASNRMIPVLGPISVTTDCGTPARKLLQKAESRNFEGDTCRCAAFFMSYYKARRITNATRASRPQSSIPVRQPERPPAAHPN